MRSSRMRPQRRTLSISLLGLGMWAVLIYWQGELTAAGWGQTLDALVALDFGRIPPPYDSLLLDGFFLLAGGALWTIFFAHYVLPIQEPGQLPKVIKEMGRSLLGRAPAALRIEKGIPRSPVNNGKERPPRILLLDSASAAVLRNDSAYTHAVGPGLNFAEAGERIAGTLDLRTQRRALGPNPEENPFSVQGPEEENASYDARQQRRKQTSGLTRDGVEVVPRIEVDFRVEGRRRSGKPHAFQAEFVWRAIASEGVSPQLPSDSQGRRVSWDWLPVHLAADVWREYLRKFTLNELFEPPGAQVNHSGQRAASSGLELISMLVNQRLREALVPEDVFLEGPDQRTVSSPEFALLRGRGLRVLEMRVREIHLDAGRDETRLVNDWSESWEQRAMRANKRKTKQSEEKERLGQQAAAAEFLRQVSSELHARLNSTDSEAPEEAESLRLLLAGSLRGAARVPGLGPEVAASLEGILSWLNEAQDG